MDSVELERHDGETWTFIGIPKQHWCVELQQSPCAELCILGVKFSVWVGTSAEVYVCIQVCLQFINTCTQKNDDDDDNDNVRGE